MKERKHSRFYSPSALARRIACTASARMEADKPDEASEYAQWGTAAHHICEKCAESGGELEPKHWLGKPVDEGDIIADQEMIDACESALDMMHWLTEGADDIKTEEHVDMPEVPDMHGTIDVLVDEPFGRLIVCDYKFGAGVRVDVTENPQLMAYALMAAGDALDTYEEIRLAVIQPRVSDKPDLWVIPPSTLAKWRDEVLLPTIEKIRSGDTEYNPGPETCRWCKAANDCPAYAKAALELARVDFTSGEPSLPVLAPTITPELVARVYPRLPMLEDFIERVRAMALDMASNGNLPGFKLVEGRGRREWIDEEAVINLLKEQGQDPYEHKILSPSKAEKLGKAVKDIITPYIKRLPGNPVIAPEGDKRRAITTAAEDFAEIAN
jgi:hypothetical protein